MAHMYRVTVATVNRTVTANLAANSVCFQSTPSINACAVISSCILQVKEGSLLLLLGFFT